MKRVIVSLLLAGLTSFLAAQELTDLARIEKARRANLGGRHGPVVTNADLLKVKIRPAVEIVTPPEEEAVSGEDLSAATEGAAPAESTPAEGQPGSAAASATPAGEAAAPAPDVIPELREKLRLAEEQVDLLKTKIAALNQDYNFQSSMVPNYVIERQLTETLQKLQVAQSEAVRLQREIDRVTLEKKLSRNPVR